uniref:Fanconi anemia core complex-associated protein 20 n=1 Tax=Pogona vitticeps TaxID=103695 RepID=A0A6J0VIP4_9SAUR
MEPRREGSKLRLKRKKQAEDSEQREAAPDGNQPPLTCRSSPAWFRKQDLSSAERTWKTLLMAVDPELDGLSLENVASLPPFLPKSFQEANPQPKPETFSVGMKQFEWVPFPLYCRENTQGKGLRSREKDTVSLIPEGKNEDSRSEVVSCILEQKLVTAPYEQTVEGSNTQHSVKHPTQVEGRERTEAGGPDQQQNSIRPSLSTTENKPEFQRLADGPATQGTKSGSKNEELLNDDTLVPSVLLPAQVLPSASFTGQEMAKNYSEELPCLDQCPMCQMHFAGTCSRLDVDSHLAKCLSESTEDVVW